MSQIYMYKTNKYLKFDLFRRNIYTMATTEHKTAWVTVNKTHP